MDDEILTLEEAAAFLKVAPETLPDFFKTGDLAGRFIAGEWRTTRRAVVSFVEGIALESPCCPPGTCCPPSSSSGAGAGCC